jgi:prepilin-type N-terminal cleavage/methylation domain-containing protein
VGGAVDTQCSSRQRGITLIELLVAMAVMGVVSAMLLAGWFALSQSYSYTVRSADARDSGQQAIARLQREVRDAERPPIGQLGTGTANDAAIYRARTYWIAFSNTFNQADNSTAAWQMVGSGMQAVPTTPRLVVYRLYSNRELWRFVDTNADNTISGVNLNPSVDNPNGFSLNETAVGEGRRLILKDVLNYTAHPGSPVPLFRYSSYDAAGQLVVANDMFNADRYTIIAVQAHLLVDVNPDHAPVYADLISTAQLRNQR